MHHLKYGKVIFDLLSDLSLPQDPNIIHKITIYEAWRSPHSPGISLWYMPDVTMHIIVIFILLLAILILVIGHNHAHGSGMAHEHGIIAIMCNL